MCYDRPTSCGRLMPQHVGAIGRTAPRSDACGSRLGLGTRCGRRRNAAAFSLLEVILAMAILFVSVAIIGELMRFGLNSARAARDKTKAILLCESLLNEIVAGITPAESFTDVPINDIAGEEDADWTCSIDVQSLDSSGLVSVTVSVRQLTTNDRPPVEVSLTRWIADPSSAGTSSVSSSSTEDEQ